MLAPHEEQSQERDFWQSRIERRLTDEDVRQIKENLTGFFKILLQWDNDSPPRTASGR